MSVYWTHNVAYHDWILRRVDRMDTVLDVGCGDGLLVQKLAERGAHAVGIEPNAPSAAAAQQRVAHLPNAQIVSCDFAAYDAVPGAYDAVVFVASIHHIDMTAALERAKSLLASGGRILIVGCARPEGLGDALVEWLRVIPAWIGSR